MFLIITSKSEFVVRSIVELVRKYLNNKNRNIEIFKYYRNSCVDYTL